MYTDFTEDLNDQISQDEYVLDMYYIIFKVFIVNCVFCSDITDPEGF